MFPAKFRPHLDQAVLYALLNLYKHTDKWKQKRNSAQIWKLNKKMQKRTRLQRTVKRLTLPFKKNHQHYIFNINMLQKEKSWLILSIVRVSVSCATSPFTIELTCEPDSESLLHTNGTNCSNCRVENINFCQFYWWLIALNRIMPNPNMKINLDTDILQTGGGEKKLFS